VYPVLLLSYVSANDEVETLSPPVYWVSVVGMTAAMAWVTWRGLDLNGGACLALTALTLLPVLALCAIGAPQV